MYFIFLWKAGELNLPGVNKDNSCAKKGIKNKAKNLLGLTKSPLLSMLDPVHLEINGNREAIIEGCKCILQYDENVVRVSVKKMSVSFYGRHLLIKCLNTDSLVVQGFITSIEFST